MALTGDWAKLSKAIQQCQTAGSRIMPRATEAARRSATAQYRSQFSGQRDPWGAAWAASPHGLDDTGTLKSAAATGRGGTVRIKPVKYWVYHQVGANGMQSRAVLPFSPSKWDAPMLNSIGIVVAQHFEPL